ncbi:MAG: hypothetical protein HY961_04755 [Ignavibacteriae bacterium]|nr:hypothetical protein [Ignavibacteriota bacterium]
MAKVKGERMPKVKEHTATYQTKKPKRKSRIERLRPREASLKLLQRMSDTATFEDILYGLYVLEKVDKGLEAVEKGQTVSHEEVKRRMSKWLK